MLVVIVVSVLGAIVLGAIGWLFAAADDGLHPERPAQPDLGPDDRPLAADDIPALRFRLAFRGYRMTDVDAALDRLAVALHAAEDRLAEQSSDDETDASG